MTGQRHSGLITDFSIGHLHLFSTAFKLGIVLLLIATSGFAIKADAQSKSSTCVLEEEESAGLNRDGATDVHAVPDYVNTIANMLKHERFEQLDCIADRARAGKERFAGGAWKLHSLYDGVSQPVEPSMHPTQEDWAALLARLKRWKEARPNSITASVALALAYIEFAWDARGEGYSDTVSNSGWKLFEQRAAEAKRILNEARALPDKCPEWYHAMQRIGIIESWDADQSRALFEEAFKFEPGYYYYTRTLASYLEPKWGGEAGDTEKFVQEIADRIGGDEGDIHYFEAAIFLICGCEGEPQLAWPRIKRGFEASEKHYGTSAANLNLIAYMAAHYGNDPDVADKTMVRIGDQWDETTWKKKEDFDSIKLWAAKYAPVARKQATINTAVQANRETPEGLRYKELFEKKYRELVRKCIRSTDAGGMDKFSTLTLVGARGTVEDMKIYWNGYAAVCVYQKLLVSKQKKTRLFPPPPHAPYWIKLELDLAEFATVASQ